MYALNTRSGTESFCNDEMSIQSPDLSLVYRADPISSHLAWTAQYSVADASSLNDYATLLLLVLLLLALRLL